MIEPCGYFWRAPLINTFFNNCPANLLWVCQRSLMRLRAAANISQTPISDHVQGTSTFKHPPDKLLLLMRSSCLQNIESCSPVACNLKRLIHPDLGPVWQHFTFLVDHIQGTSPRPSFPQGREGGWKMLFEHDKTPGWVGTSSSSCGQGGKNLPCCHFAFPLTWSQPLGQSQPKHPFPPPTPWLMSQCSCKSRRRRGPLEVSKEWSERAVSSQRDNGQKAFHKTQEVLKIN